MQAVFVVLVIITFALIGPSSSFATPSSMSMTAESSTQRLTFRQWLHDEREQFALALAPGFFCYFALLGALRALEEAGVQRHRISFVSGSSAGALIGGMYAAGLTSTEMADKVLAYTRNDFW